VAIFFPSKVALLSSLLIKLAEIWSNLSSEGQENTTFEGKKRQPKFNFRTLLLIQQD